MVSEDGDVEAGILADARYMVGNPSAWDSYDERASEIIRALLADNRMKDELLTAAVDDLEKTRAMYENLEASEVLNGYKNRAEALSRQLEEAREALRKSDAIIMRLLNQNQSTTGGVGGSVEQP